MPAPTRPAKCSFRLEESPETLHYRARTGGIGGALFMVLWLCGWSVGCVFMAIEVWNRLEFFKFLFAVPFWAFWFFVTFLLLKTLFGRESVRLDASGLRWTDDCPGFHRNRDVPLEEIVGVDEIVVGRSGDSQGATNIEIVTTGEPIRFGGHLGQRERAWLAYEIERRLGELRPEVAETTSPDEVSRYVFRSRPASAEEPDDASVRMLTPADPPQTPPSDCRYELHEDFDDFEFVRRGTLQLDAVGALLFINLFWNGIVSVFVYVLIYGDKNGRPQGGERWGMALFLVPFVVIGLAMFAALIVVWFAPYLRTRRRFGRNEFTSSDTFFGFGRTKSFPIAVLDRIEAVRIDDGPTKRGRRIFKLNTARTAGAPTYDVVLVDKTDRECAQMTDLTLGEALWAADVVLRRRPQWFR